MVLLPETPETGALRVAEKIRAAIEHGHERPGPEVTVSIGVATYEAPEQAGPLQLGVHGGGRALASSRRSAVRGQARRAQSRDRSGVTSASAASASRIGAFGRARNSRLRSGASAMIVSQVRRLGRRI